MGGGGGGAATGAAGAVVRAAPSLADEFGTDDELGFAEFAELRASGVDPGLLPHPETAINNDRARKRAIVAVGMNGSFVRRRESELCARSF
jgi:hypothetical protein